MRRRPEPSLAETVALGLIHGPAELLPVSSTAHVELLPWALSWRHASLDAATRKEVAVALHAGTGAALIGRHRLRLPFLAAATAPAAIAGWLLEDTVERATPRAIAVGLVLGSAALVLADRRPQERFAAEASVVDGAWLGLAQACALIPGVSRAGATRSAARTRGFTRAASAQLSAEVALPVLAGATALKGVRLVQRRPPSSTLLALAAGAVASFASTVAVLRFERRVSLPARVWAAYRCALAAAVLRVRHNHGT